MPSFPLAPLLRTPRLLPPQAAPAALRRPSSTPGLLQTQRRGPPPPQRQVTVTAPAPPVPPARCRCARAGARSACTAGAEGGMLGIKPAAPRRLRPLPAAAEGVAAARPRADGGGGSSRPHYGGPAASAPRRRWEERRREWWGGRDALPPGTAPPADATSRETGAAAGPYARSVTPLSDPSDTPWTPSHIPDPLTYRRSLIQPRTSHTSPSPLTHRPDPSLNLKSLTRSPNPSHMPDLPHTLPRTPQTPPIPVTKSPVLSGTPRTPSYTLDPTHTTPGPSHTPLNPLTHTPKSPHTTPVPHATPIPHTSPDPLTPCQVPLTKLVLSGSP
ncbi:uncharacterized protein LOC127463747 [Manacus candei]|uniref:uncharacterized protein LOC127463747 n=1 Tax=Manacus candei TaxID=415023 RepID=UPI0022264F39|nr:uncharacterized protein LOC127463747 [Manacus candei]